MTHSSQPETILQKEIRTLRSQLAELGNCILNKAFNLSYKGSQRRSLVINTVFIMLALALVIGAHPIGEWQAALRRFFQHLLNPNLLVANPGAILSFLDFVFTPRFMRYLPLPG
jgi:hypothetical protein